MNFKRIHVLEIDSTNTELMKKYANYENYTILTTDHQTTGRGRLNRKWEDNSYGNLMFSILLKNVIDLVDVNKLNYTVCAAIITTLDKFGIISEYKWPNDIIVSGKKISGVLIETKLIDRELIVVIGQGINVNNNYDIQNEYIYMSNILGKNISKEDVLDEFINNFKIYFLSDFAFILCKDKHCYYNKTIVINNIKYTVGDINIDGSITLIDECSCASQYFGSELSLSKKVIFEYE